MRRPETKDQKFYTVDGQLKAEIDVDVTDEDENAPPISICRFAILPLASGCVVYDRLLSRIVNGVYFTTPEDALGCAEAYNKDEHSPQDMAPNGLALGLIYPEMR